jgi:hypothetical protein
MLGRVCGAFVEGRETSSFVVVSHSDFAPSFLDL